MEWGSSTDLLTDLLSICEFSSPENSIDLEVNQNVFFDESSTSSNDTEDGQQQSWIEAPAEDNSERLMNEVAEDLRRLKGVGVYSEDDSPFLRHSKLDEAEESYVTAPSESETESSNVSYKTAASCGSSHNSSSSPATTAKRPRRKTRFRPLQETSAFSPAEKNFDWHPVEEGKLGFSKKDFPTLK